MANDLEDLTSGTETVDGERKDEESSKEDK